MKNCLEYLKFMMPYPLLLIATCGIFAGDAWMWSGIITLAVLGLCIDELLPTNVCNPQYRYPPMLNAMLFATLPFILALYAAIIWRITDFELAPSIIREWQQTHGLMHREPTKLVHLLGGVLSLSFMVAISATNIAHELMHRKNPLAVFFSQALLVFSFDAPLVISHNYGHHVEVGTQTDKTTARRGESSYSAIWRAAIGGNQNAWRIESVRLRAQGCSPFSWRNRFLRGHANAVLASAAAGLLGGWAGVALFFICAVLSKSILELINYIQHYGLVRQPGTPVELRHSWNSNKVVSSNMLLNATRHSHHHAEPGMPFWGLCSLPEAPLLPKGYLTSICISLIPPWWHRHMASSLLQWDNTFATAQERIIAREANLLSGVHRLVNSVELMKIRSCGNKNIEST